MYRFIATIEAGRGGGALMKVPLDVEKEFGTRGQVKVKATFDGEPYRGSLAPMGGGVHVLGIRKSIRATIGKDIGDEVIVELEQDLEERTVEIPPELLAAFKEAPAARKIYDAMSYTHRREHAEHVASAKKSETRERRARKAVKEMLVKD